MKLSFPKKWTKAEVRVNGKGQVQVKMNPAKFDRCVEKVKKSGSAYSPYAVCTKSVGRNRKRKNKVAVQEPEAAKVTAVYHRRLEVPHPMNWGYSPIHLSGLGATTPAQLAQQIGSIAASGVSAGIAAASLAGIISSATAASLVPIIGPAIAGVTLGIVAILNSGCGQSCILTSNWANQAEALLKQNIDGYFALPAPRQQTAQTLALANFDNVWKYLLEECGQAGLSTAGAKCTSDRMRGACTWKQTTDSPLLQYPNEPQPGACWNWFNGYRDPIAMDATIPDASGSGSTGTSVDLGTPLISGVSNSDLFLYAGAAVLLLGVLGSMN